MLKPVDSLLRTSGLLNQEAASSPSKVQQRNFEMRPGTPAGSGPAFRVSFSSQALARVVNFRNIPETLSPEEKDRLLTELAKELKRKQAASEGSNSDAGNVTSNSRSWAHQESSRGTVDYAALLEQLRNRQTQDSTTEDVEETVDTEETDVEEVDEAEGAEDGGTDEDTTAVVDDGSGSGETPVDEIDSGSGGGEAEIVVTEDGGDSEAPQPSESTDPEPVFPDLSEVV